MIENRDKSLHARATNSERELVERAAYLNGKRLSDYVREATIEKAKKDIKKFDKDLFIE